MDPSANHQEGQHGTQENKELILQKCIDFISEQEKILPTTDQVPLFYEQKANREVPTLTASEQGTMYNLHVIYSPSVSFSRSHAGATMISQGFAIFNDGLVNIVSENKTLQKNHQPPLHRIFLTSNRASAPNAPQFHTPSRPSVHEKKPRSNTAPENSTAPPTTLSSTEKEKLDGEYSASCDRLLNEQLLPWFPGAFEKEEKETEPEKSGLHGDDDDAAATSTSFLKGLKARKIGDKKKKLKPSSVPGQVLFVNGAVVDQLSPMKQTVTLNFYKDFFFSIYACINKSSYKKTLIKNKKWSSRFAYHDFTAPWMERTLSVRNEVVYLNSFAVLCIPHYKSLRSMEGSRKAKYILGAFYEQEPCLRPIFHKVLYETASIVFTFRPVEVPQATSQRIETVQTEHQGSVQHPQSSAGTHVEAAQVPENKFDSPELISNPSTLSGVTRHQTTSVTEKYHQQPLFRDPVMS